MTLKILTPELYEEYESFLQGQSESLFYHSLKYKNFLEDLLGCQANYILNYDKEKLVATLPLMLKEGRYGTVANSLPYYGSNGGVVGRVTSSALLDHYQDFVKSCVSSTLISSPFYNSIEDLQIPPTDQRISQITPLETNLTAEEYLWGIIDGSTRRNIKKAQKEGVTVSVENEASISFLEQIHNENMSVINGKAKNPNFFRKFPTYFKPNEDYQIIVAKIDNVPVSALLVFYYNKTVEYFTPVTIQEFRDKQPLALILWETMVNAIKEGYYYWNWGGTWMTQEGVYQFKKKWGAQERSYQYVTSLRDPHILTIPRSELEAEYNGFYVYNFNE